jgi:uncharacterized protein involved in response to NO
MKISAHPFWLVGFRPFFALACLAGLSLPLLWVLVYLDRFAGSRAYSRPAMACPRNVLRLRLGGAGRLPADLRARTGCSIRGYHGAR